MVGTYDPLGKRPSGAPQLGRPGVGEESLRGYTGLRVVEHQIIIAPNITDPAAQFICNNAAIGTPGTLPRSLTRVTAVSTGLPRTSIPIAMALAANFTAAAAPAGNHEVVIRISGTNQFGEPVTEDLTLTQVAGGTSGDVLGSRVFQTISAVQVIRETNTGATDDVSVYYSPQINPKFGLPVRVRGEEDIVSATVLFYAGAGVFLASDLIQLGNNITVDVGNQSVVFGTVFVDATLTWLNMRIRTSVGMDQGLRSGDKYQKAW